MGLSTLTESPAQKASLEVSCLVLLNMEFQKWKFPYWWSLYITSYIYLGCIWLGPKSENVERSKKIQNVGLQKSRTKYQDLPSVPTFPPTLLPPVSLLLLPLSVCGYQIKTDMINTSSNEIIKGKENTVWHCFHFEAVYFKRLLQRLIMYKINSVTICF